MKILNISAGGTKIVGEYGAVETLFETDWRPDVVTGISAGAILTPFVAMGILPRIKDKLLNLKSNDFFKKSPINKKGKISLFAIKRLLSGYNSLGDFGNLTKLLKKYISREEFESWQRKEDGIKAYVGSVSYTTGQRVYWDLKAIDYEVAMSAIRASASIPVFCAPVKMYHKDEDRYHYHFDGATRDFIGSEFISNKYKKSITEMINIYSKPMDNKIFEFNHDRTDKIISILTSTLNVLQTEVSKSDEVISKLLSKKYKFKLKNMYIPQVLEGPYDVDPSRLSKIYTLAKTEMKKIL